MDPAAWQRFATLRIPVWNRGGGGGGGGARRQRLSGNAAPQLRNLRSYLATHPECEVYCGQDGGGDPAAQDDRWVALPFRRQQ